MSLRGKNVLITGATGRIGWPLVEAFAAAEATLAITTRRVAACAELERELRQDGISATILSCDLRFEEDAVRTIHRLVQWLGRIDAVINAAIVTGPRLNAVDYPVDPWRDVFATNVTGTFLICREVLPWMIRQKSGSIINLTDSLIGSHGGKSAAYATSMQAVDHLTRLLAGEVKASGVRVNAVDIGQLAMTARGRGDNNGWTETFVWLADDESLKVAGQRIRAKSPTKAK